MHKYLIYFYGPVGCVSQIFLHAPLWSIDVSDYCRTILFLNQSSAFSQLISYLFLSWNNATQLWLFLWNGFTAVDCFMHTIFFIVLLKSFAFAKSFYVLKCRIHAFSPCLEVPIHKFHDMLSLVQPNRIDDAALFSNNKI